MIRGIIIETTKLTESDRKELEAIGGKTDSYNQIYTVHWIVPVGEEQYHDHREAYFTKKELDEKLKGIKKWLSNT